MSIAFCHCKRKMEKTMTIFFNLFLFVFSFCYCYFPLPFPFAFVFSCLAQWATGGKRPRLCQWAMGYLSATAIFENMFEDCECIVTTSNFHFKAIGKLQPLCHVDKLLATTANSMFCSPCSPCCVLCSLAAKLKRQWFAAS